MPQSLANVLVHIVFSTKERRALLQNPHRREEMHRYIAGVSAKLNCPTVIVGGTGDHVHLLAHQSRTIALAEWVKAGCHAQTPRKRRMGMRWVHRPGIA